MRLRPVVLSIFSIAFLLCSFTQARCDQTLIFDTPSPSEQEPGITVHFEDISIFEFLRFVGKISGSNFVYDQSLPDFQTSLIINKPTNAESILGIMIQILKQNGVKTEKHSEYFSLKKIKESDLIELEHTQKGEEKFEKVQDAIYLAQDREDRLCLAPYLTENRWQNEFHTYKLKYHQGSEIQEIIKKMAADSSHPQGNTSDLFRSIVSMQWVPSTNSLLYTGSEEGSRELTDLIQHLDVPQKQIFIEVLVIETGVKNLLNFGLEWGGGGKYRDRIGYAAGSFPKSPVEAPFAKTIKSISQATRPTGTSQFPIGKGFDLGVIGDIIFHKGASYLSLGALISALESEGDSTIILNQKIIAQDNKMSHIFVGDNLPFTGSKVTNTGSHTVENVNIEYRDVGVSLDIKPLMGEGDVITLDVNQEITEALSEMGELNGIHTTKTNMQTQAHVPNKSFLVLSGVIRNKKQKHRSGIPCLGGLPIIGAAFSKQDTHREKRSVIIFVRPQIIDGIEDQKAITLHQEKQFKSQTEDEKMFEEGIDQIKGQTPLSTEGMGEEESL